jgi:hypothetical protein
MVWNSSLSFMPNFLIEKKNGLNKLASYMPWGGSLVERFKAHKE